MKYLGYITLLFVIFSCKTQQINVEKTLVNKNIMIDNTNEITEKIELIPNRKINVVNDEWGQQYIKTLPGEKILIKYSYKQKPLDKTLQDATYSQVVWFETDKPLKSQAFESEILKNKPLYVQIYGFRNAKLIPVTSGQIQIEVIDSKTAKINIEIPDSYNGIIKRNIEQIIRVKSS